MLSFLFVLSSGFRFMLPEIQDMIAQDFPTIREQFLIYDDFNDVIEPLEQKQSSYDSIIFAGPTIYNHTRTRVRQSTHWATVPRSSNNVLRAVTEAALRGVDITKLSIDSYEEDVILEAYREIGILPEKLQLQLCADVYDDLFFEKALQHHLKQVADGNVSCCVTASTYIVNELQKRRIPYVSIIPTIDTIRNIISDEIQYHQAQRNALAQIAVIYININFPPEYSLLLSDEYSFMLQKMSITKEIYKYADRISASVAEESIYNFILFSTREPLELETNHFRRFELLDWLHDVTGYSISIGVGNGGTAVAARNSAFRAMLKAKRYRENTAFVILNNGEPEGPYTATGIQENTDSSRDFLSDITRHVNISKNTLQRLCIWVQKNNIEFTTSKELADGMKLSKRNADRLLEKLLDANLAVLCDTQMTGTRGRPARIIRFRLPHINQ